MPAYRVGLVGPDGSTDWFRAEIPEELDRPDFYLAHTLAKQGCLALRTPQDEPVTIMAQAIMAIVAVTEEEEE